LYPTSYVLNLKPEPLLNSYCYMLYSFALKPQTPKFCNPITKTLAP